jgi:HTH-type transcriptional regulator / antitoxin MqsA
MLALRILVKGNNMDKDICTNCGNDNFIEGYFNNVFNINDKLILVENIPAMLCTHCKEPVLSRGTTEHIRNMFNGNNKPKRYISVEVFEYA